MACKYHQISLKDTFSDCQNLFFDDTPSFFKFLSEHFDSNLFIPADFFSAFYKNLGRNRVYPLQGFLSAFDSAGLYGALFHDFHFSKALIPYNPRNVSPLKKIGYNEYGYPICTNASSLAMKYHSITREKRRTVRIKWGCPRRRYQKGQWRCECMHPCSIAKKEEPHTLMKTWNCVCFLVFSVTLMSGTLPTKADVFLAGIASQLTVIVAHAMNCPQFIRSLKPLIA